MEKWNLFFGGFLANMHIFTVLYITETIHMGSRYIYIYLPNEQSLTIQKQSRSRHPPYERLYFITFSMDCAGQKQNFENETIMSKEKRIKKNPNGSMRLYP